VRAITRPATVVETVIPSIAGTSSRPACVGVAPVVVCRNSGTKTVTANSAAVARNSAALVTRTVRVRSSASGTIGSAARRSLSTRLIPSSTAAAPSPSVSGEPQA
jgi:hypothetical protein